MQTVFIVLIVITCLAPIFTGGGYGIAKLLEIKTSTPEPTTPTTTTAAPTCSPKCTDLEECKKNNGGINKCECRSRYFRNNIDNECEPKYEWVNYTAGLKNDPRLVRSGLRKHVITRWICNNDNVLVTHDRIDYLKRLSDDFRDTSPHFKRLEVLLAEPDLYEWKSWSNGAIPNNAIEGGQHQNKTVHVCRFKHYDRYYGGMVNRDDRICYSVNWAVSSFTYDTLVYKP